MTVGTGTKDNQEDLAYGLTKSIIHYKPQKIVFLGSNKSREVIELIESCYEERMAGKLPEYEFVELPNIDEFDSCFESLKSKIEDYENKYSEEIVIDYTSGTKTMTISAAIVSLLYHKKLSLVRGKRQSGVVIKGTESISEQNLFQAYDKLLMEEAKNQFNNYRFTQALETLNRIIIHEEKDKLLQMFEGYREWDHFNHHRAFELIKELKNEGLDRNKAFLGRLVNAENKDKEMMYKLILADLINNARRRIDECKYDDAAARLYRAVELISQIKLLGYGIDEVEKGIKVDDVKDRVDTQNYSSSIKDDRLLLGVEGKFNLLNDLGWKDSLQYYKEIKNYLTKRNGSILAHGINPISKEDAEEFYKKVKGIAIEVFQIEKYLEESNFVKI